MTDADFLAAVLADGEWHSHNDILESSIHQRGHGLTVHSRASDLRTKRGMKIETKLRSSDGRTVSFYRLALEEVVASPEALREGTDGSTTASSSAPPRQRGVTLSAADEPSSRDEGALTLSPPILAPAAGSTGVCDRHGSQGGGVLELFACEVDESAGLRGAYWDDAA